MSQRGQQRPTAKNILVDEFLSPEQMKKMHENQVRLRGKVSSANTSLEKPNSREFVIQTDSREIPRVSILTNREEPSDNKAQAAMRLEKCIRLKLTKIKFQVFTKLVGRGQQHLQKRFACRILAILVEWKRKQHLLRSFRHAFSYGLARSKLRKAVPTLSRLIRRLQLKRVSDFFRKIIPLKSHERSRGGLSSQHASQQASQQASQSSLQLNLDPSKAKSASSSSRFVRKPAVAPETLTDRPAVPSNYEQQIRDYEQLMLMSLSNEAREALIKMQRFDRYIYAQESEKHLKVPIEVELRRLQRIKNSDKTLRNIYFDTELSITVLFNHIKTVFELNRELKEMEVLKEQNKALEDRIIEINVQKTKEIKEITAALRKPADENARLKGLEAELKENKKLNEALYQAIRQGANDKARKLLEVQIRKHQNQTTKELSLDRREMLEIIQLLINTVKEKPEARVEQQTSINLAEFRGDLKGLLEAQAALQKNITYLEKQKRIYETKQAESKTADNRQLYSVLGLGSGYIGSLYAEIKLKNGEIAELNRKIQETDRERQRSDRLKSDSQEKGMASMNKLRADLENERAKSKDLQKKLSELNRSLKTDKEKQSKQKEKEDNDGPLRQWEQQLANLIAKIEKEERTWYGDVQRQRKLLNTKRTTDRYTNVISQNILLLETIIKRQRALEQLSTEIAQLKQVNPASESKRQQIEQKLTKEREKVKQLTDERNALKKELQDIARNERPQAKNLLANELGELQKAITSIEQVFAKQAESEIQQPLDWARIKKMIDRRKFNSTLPVIGFIETLMRMLGEWEQSERRKQADANRSEASKQRQVNTMGALNKTIDRVLDEKNLKLEDITFNRLRKILENNITKYDKAGETGESAWCGLLKDAAVTKQRIMKLFEDDHKALAGEIDQLQSYVGQLQTQMKTDKQTYDRTLHEATTRISQLEHTLKTTQQHSERTHKEESDMIMKLQEERGHLISKLERKQHDVKRLEDKTKSLESKQAEHMKEIKEFKEAIEMYSKEERAMLNAIELAENENRSLLTQLDILTAGTGEQDKQRARAQHDRNEVARMSQNLAHLQKQLQIKEQTMKKNDEHHRRTIEQFQQDMKNVQGNLNRLLQLNSNLEHEKQQLEKQVNKTKRESNDGDSQLASENVKLYNEVVKVQQKLTDIENSFRMVEEENIRLREQLTQRQQQHLNLINKINRLEKELVDFRSENDMLVVNIDQLEQQLRNNRDKLLDTERNNRQLHESIRVKEETYKTTIFELRSEIQRNPSPLLVEEFKQDFKRKEEGYLKLIEQIRLSISKGNEQDTFRAHAELERANSEMGRLRAQLKSQEDYIRQLSDQHEGAIQRRVQSYESQMDILRKELDQLAVTQPEAMRRLDAEHRQRESELFRHQEEALNKCYNKERELQSEVSTLRSEVMRLNKTSSGPNTLEIELKRQQEHYERILTEGAATTQSQIRLLEGESTRLKNEIARLQKQAREREEYYTRLMESNEQMYASREKASDSSTTNIKLQLSRQARDSNLDKQLQIELKRQEEHYVKLIEQNLAIFESKEKSYETEIGNLQQQITKLTRETVQHSIVQNLQMELHRQQDHYIKLIEQNNIIFQSKEKSFETEVTQLRNQLGKYQLNLRAQQDNHLKVVEQSQALATSKEKLLQAEISRLRTQLMRMETDVKIPAEGVQQELRKQKEYYTLIIEQNNRSYEQQRNELEAEVIRLKAQVHRSNRDQSSATLVATLQQELKRQEQHYLLLLSQNNAVLQSKERSFQAEVQQMRGELMKTEASFQSQQQSYKKLLSQNSSSSTQKIRSLETEISGLREALAKLQANPPLNRTLLNQELHKQKMEYTLVIEQNIRRFTEEEGRHQIELKSLSNTNSMLTMEISRLKFESTKTVQLTEQAALMQADIEHLARECTNYQALLKTEADRSAISQSELAKTQAEVTRLARELENNKVLLKSETERLVKEVSAVRNTAQADVDRLNRQLQVARSNSQSTVNEQLRRKDEYYTKLIDQNRVASETRTKDLDAMVTRLKEELLATKNQLAVKTKDFIHPEVLDREIKNMELHLSRMLDENAATFQAQQGRLLAQINELQSQLGRVQTEGSQHTISVRKMSGDLQQRDDQLRKVTTDLAQRDDQLRRTTADLAAKDDQFKRVVAELQGLKKIAGEGQKKDQQIRSITAQLELTKRTVVEAQRKDDQIRGLSGEVESLKRGMLEVQKKDQHIRGLSTQLQNVKRAAAEALLKQQHIQRLVQELQQKDEHFRHLIGELEQRDEHIKVLILEHQQKDERMLLTSKQMKQKDDDLTKLKSELKAKQDQTRKVASDQSTVQLREKSLQQQIVTLTQKEKGYQEQLSAFNQRQGALQEQVAHLKRLLDESGQTMMPIAHFEQELHKQEHHFTQLLDMNATTYMEQEKKYELEIESLKRTVAEGAGKQLLENELRMIKERNSAAEKAWQMEIQQFNSNASSLQSEALGLRTALAKIEGEKSKLEIDKGKLEAQNGNLRGLIVEVQQLHITVSNLQTDLRNAQGEKQQLLNNLGHLQLELNNLSAVQGQAQHLKGSMSALQNEVSGLRTVQTEYLQLKSKFAAMESELNQGRSLLTDNQQLRNTLGGLQAEITALKALQNEYTQLRGAASTLEFENSSLKGVLIEAQQLRVTLANVQNQLNTLRAAQLQLQQLKLKMGGMEYELAQSHNIEADNQQLRSMLLALQNDLNSLRNVQLQAQQLRVRVGGLETDLQESRKEAEVLRASMSSSETATKSQARSLQVELQKLRREYEQVQRQCSELKKNPPPQLMESELRKQEQHFIKLLDDNAAIFQGKEKELEADIHRAKLELRKQQDNFMKLLDENAHIFQAKERQYDSQIFQLRQELDKQRETSVSVSISTKEVESLKAQLTSQEQLYKSQLQTQEQLFKSQLQSLEQQSKSQMLMIEQQNQRFLNEANGNQSQLEIEANRVRSELILLQKDRDLRIQENLERMKFYEQHTDKLTKTVADLESKLTQSKSEIFKLREVSHTLQLHKARLEEQFKMTTSSSKMVDQTKMTLLLEERTRFQIEGDRLRLKSEEELQIRRELQEKYSSVMREKSSLLERIDKLQSQLYDKEMEMVRSFQKREENIQELIAENKSLQSQLKKIQEKLLAYEFKSVLSPANVPVDQSRTQPNPHEAELQLLRDENSFVKERIRFLESQFRQNLREVRPDPVNDKYLLRMEGERLKQNLQEVEHHNMDLLHRINALTRVQGDRDDLLELGILKKINEEVTELVDNNKLLNDQVRLLEAENRNLNQTISSLARGGSVLYSGQLNSGEQMAGEIARVMDNVAQLLNEQGMPEQLCDRYDHFMERLEGCLEKHNLHRYLEIFEEFIRTIFISLIEAKDHMLQKQAATLLELREKMGDLIDQQIQESEYSDRMSPQHPGYSSLYEDRHPLGVANGVRRADLHSLQHLWKHYVKYRRADTLEEIGRMLQVEDQ